MGGLFNHPKPLSPCVSILLLGKPGGVFGGHTGPCDYGKEKPWPSSRPPRAVGAALVSEPADPSPGRSAWAEEEVESSHFSGQKNSCSPPQSGPRSACLGQGNAHGQGSGERKGEAVGLVCLARQREREPCAPPSTVCLHRLLFSLPACPTGLLGRHRYYCPQRTPPARPKGGVTHGAATSPQPARGV